MSGVDREGRDEAADNALFRRMADEIEARMDHLGETQGSDALHAYAFASISVGAVFLSMAMGSAYCLDYVDEVAKPLRDALTEYGGPAAGTCQ